MKQSNMVNEFNWIYSFLFYSVLEMKLSAMKVENECLKQRAKTKTCKLSNYIN